MPGLFERAFIVVSVLVYATEILRIAFPGEADATSVSFRLIHFGFYAAFLALILRRPASAASALAMAPALAVLLALPILSTVWSTSTFMRFRELSTICMRGGWRCDI